MPSVSFKTVEFHRFGQSADSLKKGQPYIRITGWDELAAQVSPNIDQPEVEEALNKLRYWRAANADDVTDGQQALGTEAVHFLSGVTQADGADLHQLDVLTNAGELWAFPFEAAYGSHASWLKDGSSGVVITRRVRGGFSDTATAWPVVPRVLLLHAPLAEDLDQAFIDQHTAALVNALEPWARGKEVLKVPDLLTVCEVTSVDEIEQSCTQFKPTCVHVVAHGAPFQKSPFSPAKEWSLRLRVKGDADVSAGEIAAALRKKDSDSPLRVVTFATCDSADQGVPVYAGRSIAQELHLNGVPVVIGSQLPLTKEGSLRFAGAFYERLFQGDDVRCALHAGRVAVRASEEAFHDWLSLVAYVRLPPEGYVAYLEEVGLKAELGLLNAAQAQADELNKSGGELQAFDAVEQLVRKRLQSLGERRAKLRRQDLDHECSGLEASAYKRLAELLFLRGVKHPAQAAADLPASRQALEQSLTAYRGAFETDLKNHWHGIQQMTLEAALTGRVARDDDWAIVTRSAENDLAFAARTSGQEYWAHGTLCELALLGPRAGGKRDLDKARAHARLVVDKAREANDSFPIESTRRQISRYIWWWTNAHGYFPGTTDLSADAGELLTVLVLD